MWKLCKNGGDNKMLHVRVGREGRVAVKPPFPFHREYDASPFFSKISLIFI